MNFARIGIATLFLIVAFIMQAWIAPSGVFINFVFAALMTYGALFEFWEVLFFVLLSVFILNWQPAPSAELFLFLLLPLVVHFIFRFFSSFERWTKNIIAIFAGVVLLHAIFNAHSFFANLEGVIIDIGGSLAFGQLIFFALRFYT